MLIFVASFQKLLRLLYSQSQSRIPDKEGGVSRAEGEEVEKVDDEVEKMKEDEEDEEEDSGRSGGEKEEGKNLQFKEAVFYLNRSCGT